MLAPDEISLIVGLQASKFHLRKFPQDGTRRGIFNRWSYELSWDGVAHGGTKGIWDALVSLGPDVASRFARLPQGETDCYLSILQDMDGQDDTGDLGIQISVEAIDWLGRARMYIDIDQYVDRGGDDD